LKVVLSVDPIKFPLTGIGRYTYELGKGLQREELESLNFLRGYRLSRDLPEPNDAQPMAGASHWKTLAQQSRLAVAVFRQLNPWLKSQALKGFEDHIYHGPNYYLPPFGGRSVVTVHDLSHYVWTQAHPPERVRYMQAEMELSLRRAAAIITDTEYTRQEVAKHFGWPLERIYAVHLASGPEFAPRSYEALAPALQALDLEPGGYCLFTGTVEPRKNLSSLLQAYGRLPATTRLRWPLVVAGYRGWESDALHESLQRAQREGWLKYLGFVPHHTLPLLMAGARLFVYPSHYEGFGLPVLEAMASGVPVVCSNASTLPEVSGGAAAMHAPNDVDALFNFLFVGLEDEAWRAKAHGAGLQQAGRFSWAKCARETLAVYKAVSKA
jgi:glycosyltransferase involved in cell wall biosynthesis